jgi:hypothetical protein
MDDRDLMLRAIREDHLPMLKLLMERGTSMAAPGRSFHTLLGYAAFFGRLSIVKWLVQEFGAPVSEIDGFGYTALLHAAKSPYMPRDGQIIETVQWLLEYGGANVADMNSKGQTIWDLLLIDRIPPDPHNPAEKSLMTALLRVMVLQASPPAALTAQLFKDFKAVVQDGARLRARLPAYLARRRALLDESCPLIGPLQALVLGYEEPTTTAELWATGLGAA